MTRDPYNRNSNERTNQEVKKATMFIIFASNVQVLCHIKIFLKLINALKMKNVFILTELPDKTYVCIYLTEGKKDKKDKNEVFSGFLKEAKIQSRSGT